MQARLLRARRGALESLALLTLTAACASAPSPAPPEATPLPQPQVAEVAPPLAPPVESPKDAEEAPSSVPAAAPPPFKIAREGTLVTIARAEQPCPWAEYSPEWKGLRLRSDRAGCEPLKLTESTALARELFDGLAKELGAEFTPHSFGMNDYPEMYERVARAAAASPDWNAAAGKPKTGSVNTFVVALASSSEFYPELVALFAPQKLTPQFTNVEKVFVGKVSETPFAASLTAAGVKDGSKVPYGSIVWFRLTEP
jgi:hypothetical protein